jgi:hypothetical protein
MLGSNSTSLSLRKGDANPYHGMGEMAAGGEKRKRERKGGGGEVRAELLIE